MHLGTNCSLKDATRSAAKLMFFPGFFLSYVVCEIGLQKIIFSRQHNRILSVNRYVARYLLPFNRDNGGTRVYAHTFSKSSLFSANKLKFRFLQCHKVWSSGFVYFLFFHAQPLLVQAITY